MQAGYSSLVDADSDVSMRQVGEQPDLARERQPVVSIITVTWNSVKEIGDCLESLIVGCGDLVAEVIVVDNASRDGTLATIASHFSDVHLIRNHQNLGFAAASNQGLLAARGSYLMLLNPDTMIDRESLGRLVKALDNDPSAGMVGPRLVSPSGAVQATSARRLPTLPFIILQEGLRLGTFTWGRRLIRIACSTPEDLDRSHYVQAISGAAMLIRREVVEAVGLLDDLYRHCGEDVDYCLRVLRTGWRIAYVHDAVVVHHGGASSSQAPYRTLLESFLGIYRYYRKNWSLFHAAVFRVAMIAFRVPVLLARGIVKFATGREGRRGLLERLRVARAIIRFSPYESNS